MKILFLTSRLPFPPDRGDRLRAYNFIRQFAEEHDVFLLSCISDKNEYKHINELEKICRGVEIVHIPFARSALNCGRGLFSRTPLQVWYYKSPAFAKTLHRLLEKVAPDIIYCQLFRLFPYVENSGVYTIVDLTDMVSLEIERSLPHRREPWRTIYRIEYPRIVNYEKYAGCKADEVWFISEHDASIMRETKPGARIEVIAQNFSGFCMSGGPAPFDPGRVVMTGNYDVPHNMHAAKMLIEEIFPRVVEKAPGARLVFIGRSSERIRELAPPPFVEIAGYVDDLAAELRRAAVFVSPLMYCAGLQNKIVEAMLNGIPVVTSWYCNHGITAEPGRDLLIAETPGDFADAVLKILKSTELRNSVGDAGMKFARSHFCKDTALDRINGLAAATDKSEH